MNNNQKIIMVVLFTALLILISPDSFAESNFSIFPEGEKPNGFVFTLSLFLALIAALTAHELGHLVSGLAQGFRFELFVVFILGIKRTENGIRVFLNRDLGYMGGVSATVPITNDSDYRKKFAIMVLAGPIASLLFAVVCFLFLIFTKDILWSFWLIACASSIGLFFATTIPSKTGIYFSDRARFQRLISKGPDGKSEEALLQIIGQTMAENSCKNISIDNARLLQNDSQDFMRFWGHYYEYEFYKSNKNLILSDEARKRLVGFKGAITEPIWKALKIDE